MASKQPFKIFDWKKKLITWSIKINKTIKHKVLSKSRNALIITADDIGSPINPLDSAIGIGFQGKVKNLLKKTWDIHELSLKNTDVSLNYEKFQKQFGGKQYDAIIVMPHSNRNLKGFYNIEEEKFSTDLQSYNKNILRNMIAYRFAHKYLATSGVLIYSNSQSDFIKVQNKDVGQQVKQAHLKNIIDSQLSYLAVTVGDRDYTDLNSWSVVGLSEQFIGSNNQDFVAKVYCDWANGNNLPMPGSFAIFKTNEEGKKSPFVEYL